MTPGPAVRQWNAGGHGDPAGTAAGLGGRLITIGATDNIGTGRGSAPNFFWVSAVNPLERIEWYRKVGNTTSRLR